MPAHFITTPPSNKGVAERKQIYANRTMVRCPPHMHSPFARPPLHRVNNRPSLRSLALAAPFAKVPPPIHTQVVRSDALYTLMRNTLRREGLDGDTDAALLLLASGAAHAAAKQPVRY